MVVRIRLRSKLINPGRGRAASQATVVLSSLLAPAALMAWALGGWSLLAGMDRAGEFAIRSGLLSHWQVWIAVAIAVQFAAFLISRVGRPERRALQDSATHER